MQNRRALPAPRTFAPTLALGPGASPTRIQRERLPNAAQEVVDSLGVEEVRAIASRIEVNLIDLYGKIGFDYPRDEASDQKREHTRSKAAARRGNIA